LEPYRDQPLRSHNETDRRGVGVVDIDAIHQGRAQIERALLGPQPARAFDLGQVREIRQLQSGIAFNEGSFFRTGLQQIDPYDIRRKSRGPEILRRLTGFTGTGVKDQHAADCKGMPGSKPTHYPSGSSVSMRSG